MIEDGHKCVYDTLLIRIECGVCQLISTKRDECFIFVTLNFRYQCNNIMIRTYGTMYGRQCMTSQDRMSECEFLNGIEKEEDEAELKIFQSEKYICIKVGRRIAFHGITWQE